MPIIIVACRWALAVGSVGVVLTRPGNVRPTPPPRLALLWASRAETAVIFRRGPSKRVEVIRWNTARDTFERGHWFHGRIYAKRSDLSPDGELLVYFASKFNRHTIDDSEYTYAWTAVSRPPWLTALALWPKGDCWHGGGLFDRKRRLLLNHRPKVAIPHPKHMPRGLEVIPDPNASGEDDPLYSRRLDRDGWTVRQAWEVEYHGPPDYFRTLTPEIRVRRRRGGTGEPAVVMERRLDFFRYRETFRLEGAVTSTNAPFAGVDWLDWDQGGRLVLLHEGRLLVADVVAGECSDFRQLADFRGDTPQDRETPPSARTW